MNLKNIFKTSLSIICFSYASAYGMFQDNSVITYENAIKRFLSVESPDLIALFVHDNNIARVKELLPAYNPNKSINHDVTPLMIACANGDLEMVKLLLDAGAEINLKANTNEMANYRDIACNNCGYPNDSALTLAVNNGHLEIVKLLIERGADFELLGGENIYKGAIRHDQEKVATYLSIKLMRYIATEFTECND